MSKFSMIVLSSVVLMASGLGGCAGGGGFGGGNDSGMTSYGVPGDRTLVDDQGRTHKASQLVELGGTKTSNGVAYRSFAKQKSTGGRILDGLGRTLVTTGSAYGGAAISENLGGGARSTSVAAVGTGKAGEEIYNGVTGAGDPNIIWISAEQLNPQPASLATAK